MSAVRSIVAVARSDFQERTRRYSFLLTLLFAVFLGYATATGRIILQLEEYRGVYTSGWIGTLVAMVVTCFVSLVGFYVVKNAVERDRVTGVGQILAATPLSKSIYAFGKFLSNFVVLSSMVAVLAVAALIMQFVAAEDPRVDLWALLSPFLLLALPAMAITGAAALCFEMLPGLRGGFGNIAWFFVWTAALSSPLLTGARGMDPFGMTTVLNSLSAEGLRHVPGYHGGLAFQIQTGQQVKIAQDLRWSGIAWDLHSVSLRLMWFAVATGLAFAISLIFDRFDSAKSSGSVAQAGSPSASAALQALPAASKRSAPATVVHLTPLSSAARSFSFLPLFRGELRLVVKGFRWWWYAIAAGLLIAQFVSPLGASRGPLLGVAWIWPALLWSAMGSRESKLAVRSVLFSSPKILPRQWLACWMAGFAVAVVTGAGTIVRLLLVRQANSFCALIAGAVFIPSLALALGIISGSSKFFEGLYTLLWYIGPMNHTPGFDYTGASDGAHPLLFALKYLLISLCLGAAAYLYRARQLRGN